MDRRLDGRYVGNDFKAKRVTNGLSYEDGNFVTKVAKATFDKANTLTRITSNLNILNSLNKLNWCTHYSTFLEKIN